MTLRIRPENRSRLVWLLALLAFMFGCRTFASYESSIAKTSAATEELGRRIKTNDQVIAHAATLRRSEQLARADLMQVSIGQQPAVSTADFLRRLEYTAAQLQLSVVSVTPGEIPALKTVNRALVPLPVTVVIRGKFRSMVRFIQETTRQNALTELVSAQLVVSSLPSARAAELDATIHLTLYRLLLNVANAQAN